MNRTALKELAERMFNASQGRQGGTARPDRKLSKRRDIMKKSALTILCLALVAGLAGCAAPTPMLDQTFGDAVRTARTQQIVNPEASRNADPVAGIDGVAAAEAMGRYHDSFKTPPPVVNVINIGGSVSGGQ